MPDPIVVVGPPDATGDQTITVTNTKTIDSIYQTSNLKAQIASLDKQIATLESKKKSLQTILDYAIKPA